MTNCKTLLKDIEVTASNTQTSMQKPSEIGKKQAWHYQEHNNFLITDTKEVEIYKLPENSK